MNKFTVFLVSTVLVATTSNHVQAAELTDQVAQPVVQVATANLKLDVTSYNPISQEKVALTTVEPVAEPMVVAQTKPKSLKELAQVMVTEEFGSSHFAAFDKIVQHESGWNLNAVNASSGACGLGQALPCSKITDKSPEGQLKWMLSYISDRYGTPANAWNFWQQHNWY